MDDMMLKIVDLLKSSSIDDHRAALMFLKAHPKPETFPLMAYSWRGEFQEHKCFDIGVSKTGETVRCKIVWNRDRYFHMDKGFRYIDKSLLGRVSEYNCPVWLGPLVITIAEPILVAEYALKSKQARMERMAYQMGRLSNHLSDLRSIIQYYKGEPPF